MNGIVACTANACSYLVFSKKDEKYLPADVLTRLKADETWKDDEGFSWGWGQLCAETDSDGAVEIKVASIYHGQGYRSVKY